jgi:hypothetical protein
VTPQDQEFVNIEGKQYGDCMRACVASLLDMPIAQVPHFLRDASGDPQQFWENVMPFAESRGWDYLCGFTAHLPDLAADLDGYHVIGGPSPRGGGLLHAVVGRYGAIVFDPHPSKAGLLGTPADWDFDYMVRL